MQDDVLMIPCSELHEMMATYPAEMSVVVEMLAEAEALPCPEFAA